jgi:CHASE2 domain-containing sensor protein
MAGRKQFLHSLHHFLAGAMLIIKGIDKISHHHVFMGSLILLFGIMILSFFVYTLIAKQHGHRLELMVRWFEALVSLFSAYLFFSEGKKWLPYFSILAAIGFFISIYIFHKKKRQAALKQNA